MIDAQYLITNEAMEALSNLRNELREIAEEIAFDPVWARPDRTVSEADVLTARKEIMTALKDISGIAWIHAPLDTAEESAIHSVADEGSSEDF